MVSNYDVVKGLGKDCSFFLKGFIHGHLIIPTLIIRTNENDLDDLSEKAKNEEFLYFVGGIVPVVGHLFLGAYPILGYLALFNFTDIKLAAGVLATQVLTNLSSGIYEIFRYKKSQLENHSTSKPNELEEKVDEPVIPEEKKEDKLTFINPFEVDIPEFKK